MAFLPVSGYGVYYSIAVVKAGPGDAEKPLDRGFTMYSYGREI
ncbi:MAG TPA: hypothetical protein VES58_00575 [Syntrophobacteria bacterium]|nr:hypothetical protein [Syntrophobacteria bacterium]